MEFFVGNLIVAGLSDWGCVLIPTGLPAELIPHIFSLCPATCVIIPAAPPFVNLFCKVFSVNWTVQAHRPGTAPSTQNSASRRQALPEGCAVIFVPVTAYAWNQSGTLCPHGCAGYWPGASRRSGRPAEWPAPWSRRRGRRCPPAAGGTAGSRRWKAPS